MRARETDGWMDGWMSTSVRGGINAKKSEWTKAIANAVFLILQRRP